MKFSSCMLVALCLALNLYGQDSKQVENVQKFKADFGGKMIVKWNKSANCPSKIYADNISFKNYLIVSAKM